MFLTRAEAESSSSIRVAIVEDDEFVRESLAVLINGALGFRCVGAYGSAEEALRALPVQIPDVVLMDIRLPQMTGVECVRQLKTILPEVQIIMLTMFEDDIHVFDSLQAGAVGYLLKRTPHVQILAAIEEVNRGGSPMSSAVARKVVQLASRTSSPGTDEETGLGNLSPREQEILELLAKGYRYKEIARNLEINIETVRTHLRRIYDKLQVTSRTEAVVKFLRH